MSNKLKMSEEKILEDDKKKILIINKSKKLENFEILWINLNKTEVYEKRIKKKVLDLKLKLGYNIIYYKKYFNEEELNELINNIKKMKKENLNKNFQNIENKIYDDFEKLLNKKQEKINYYDLYAPYKEIQNLFNNKSNISINELNKLLLQNEYILYENSFCLKKNTKIYKGVKYFYSKKEELPFLKKLKYGYYGDKYIALKYAKLYHGGLQVYKTKKDFKLFNVTNDDNIRYILSLINENSNEIFFKNFTYKKFSHYIKMKYGVNINKYYQAYLISLYFNYYPVQWLIKKEDVDYLPEIDSNGRKYTGWYFGHGYIDRICLEGIMNLIKDKYDGVTCIAGYYTPYMERTQNEVIIWNQQSNLERIETDPLDSMNFKKILPFDVSKILLNEKISICNINFKFNLFYFDNYFTNKKIFDVPKELDFLIKYYIFFF
jgi:hypothetical protein